MTQKGNPCPSVTSKYCKLFAETDRKFAETDLKFQETDRLVQETSREVKKMTRGISELRKLFESQWGKLMESLVEGDLVNLLVRRGIPVTDTTSRLKGRRADGGIHEFNIIAHNGDDIVVVEVKTTLKPDHVKDFIDKLDHIKIWVPRYAPLRILGAMAWPSAETGAEAMAENRGPFSIRATGDSASILNASDFQPRPW
jgi:hypothetical protein